MARPRSRRQPPPPRARARRRGRPRERARHLGSSLGWQTVAIAAAWGAVEAHCNEGPLSHTAHCLPHFLGRPAPAMEASSSAGGGAVDGAHVQALAEFLLGEHGAADGPRAQLAEVLAAPDVTAHYSVRINANILAIDHAALVEVLLKTPGAILPCLDEAVQIAQRRIHEQHTNGGQAFGAGDAGAASWTRKPYVHGRVHRLPAYPGVRECRALRARVPLKPGGRLHRPCISPLRRSRWHARDRRDAGRQRAAVARRRPAGLCPRCSSLLHTPGALRPCASPLI